LYQITAVNQTPVYASGWFHVAVTYSGGDDVSNIVMYINGIRVANYGIGRNGVGAYQSDAARELRLGRSAWNNYASADFDDSRIYSRALSAQEIALLASQ
jgi:hypothetical protein